jgi:hypothetical protein
MKFVLLDHLFGECRNLLFGLSFILRKGHPFANDFSARRVVIHVLRFPRILESIRTCRATSIPSSFLRSEGKGRLIVGGELLERERVFKKLGAEMRVSCTKASVE